MSEPELSRSSRLVVGSGVGVGFGDGVGSALGDGDGDSYTVGVGSGASLPVLPHGFPRERNSNIISRITRK